MTDLASAAQRQPITCRAFSRRLVTAGGDGVAGLRRGEAPVVLPALPVNLVSTHGAGDVFVGALVTALAAGHWFAECLQSANAAAAPMSRQRRSRHRVSLFIRLRVPSHARPARAHRDRDDEDTHCGNSRPADACCARRRPGRLSVQAHHHDRAVRGRRLDRRDRPRRRRGAAPGARPAGGGRQSRRRRRLDRHRGDREGARPTATPSAWARPRRWRSTRRPTRTCRSTCSTISAPIGNIAAVPNIMSVHPVACRPPTWRRSSRSRARSRASCPMRRPGIGSVSHLLGEQFKLATGTDIMHVPYRGVGPALNDAVGGQVQVMFDNLPTSLRAGAGRQAARARRVGRQARRGAARRADLRRTQARRHQLDGVLRAGRAEGHAGADREAAQRGAGAGAGDARGARQARRRSRPSWSAIRRRRSRRRSRANWRDIRLERLGRPPATIPPLLRRESAAYLGISSAPAAAPR